MELTREQEMRMYEVVYHVACDAVVRAVHDWPVKTDDVGPWHTSSYARAHAMRIMDAVIAAVEEIEDNEDDE